jgi:HEPN domain-containing protein
MAERSADWIRQAIRDLESAKAQKVDGFYEWTCFISQQASEKALKAVLQRMGAEAWGHSVLDLLRALREKADVPAELDDSARYLDRFYIPSRYPNGWASGIPAEYIMEVDAEQAINHSKKIVQFCNGLLAR